MPILLQCLSLPGDTNNKNKIETNNYFAFKALILSVRLNRQTVDHMWLKQYCWLFYRALDEGLLEESYAVDKPLLDQE